MNKSTPGRVFLTIAVAFMAMMILMPLFYPSGSFTGLDGSAGVIENWDKLSFSDPLTRSVYTLGDLFCHQEQARSFMINGSQMAFCQRDVSMLFGIIIGLLFTDIFSRKMDVGARMFLYVGIILTTITIIEWVVESVFDIDILVARAATGVMTGIGIAMVLQYAFTRQYEKIMGFD